MVNAAPVTKRPSGPASQATIPAMSSALPNRGVAIFWRWWSACGPSAGFMSVSVEPGWTTLAVMPRGPRSRARALVNPTSAALLAEYRKAPDATRNRLYYDTMESVLAKTRTVIVDGHNNEMFSLPLDRMVLPLPGSAAAGKSPASSVPEVHK